MLRKVPKWLWVISIVCVAIYAPWQIAYPSGSWRYKLTVSVETPEGVKTGSAVREVNARRFFSLLSESDFAVAMTKGEAVVIDLGDRGTIFALNRTYRHGVDGGHYIVSETFPAPHNEVSQIIQYYRSLKAVSTPVAVSAYPMFVRFRDPFDPKTVENLLEMKACPDTDGAFRPLCIKRDRFAEVFGQGVALKSITIEMTREPITKGVVEKVLPWIQTVGKGNLGGGRFSGPEFFERLGAWDFRRGEE